MCGLYLTQTYKISQQSNKSSSPTAANKPNELREIKIESHLHLCVHIETVHNEIYDLTH